MAVRGKPVLDAEAEQMSRRDEFNLVEV